VWPDEFVIKNRPKCSPNRARQIAAMTVEKSCPKIPATSVIKKIPTAKFVLGRNFDQSGHPDSI
jgi:hypothetical protein